MPDEAGQWLQRSQWEEKQRGPDLVSILGIVLGAASLVATGIIGLYWLGFTLALSIAVWRLLSYRHAVRRAPEPERAPMSWVLRGARQPGFVLSLVGLVTFAYLLVWGEPREADPVVAPRPGAGVELFEDALGDNFKTWALDIQQLQTEKGPGTEAPVLGGWWSLADWCVLHKRGTPGVCYDLAAQYVQFWFQRDPRTINAENWLGAGAIGGLVVDGYDSSQRSLHLDPSGDHIPDLFAGRPGIALLCEPSCAARM